MDAGSMDAGSVDSNSGLLPKPVGGSVSGDLILVCIFSRPKLSS